LYILTTITHKILKIFIV